jgi:hypothetical protein
MKAMILYLGIGLNQLLPELVVVDAPAAKPTSVKNHFYKPQVLGKSSAAHRFVQPNRTRKK